MAKGRTLDNWSISTTAALHAYNSFIKVHELYRKTRKDKYLNELKLKIETLLFYIFEEINILSNDRAAPLKQIANDMVFDSEKKPDIQLITAAAFAVLELMSKIDLYKISITTGETTDLTKLYEEY